MSINEVHIGQFGTNAADEFERRGHPGRFHASYTCVSGTLTTFTGSLFGAGGIIVPSGSTGTVYLSYTGSIPLTTLALSGGGLHELSIRSVNVTAGSAYILIKNQIII